MGVGCQEKPKCKIKIVAAMIWSDKFFLGVHVIRIFVYLCTFSTSVISLTIQ